MAESAFPETGHGDDRRPPTSFRLLHAVLLQNDLEAAGQLEHGPLKNRREIALSLAAANESVIGRDHQR